MSDYLILGGLFVAQIGLYLWHHRWMERKLKEYKDES